MYSYVVLFRNGREDRMTEIRWTVEGRHFRSQDEYEAALRDKELIDSITQNFSKDNPKDIERVYNELQSGRYQFETIVGRQFDDNIYELYERIKKSEAEKLEQRRLKKEKHKRKGANRPLKTAKAAIKAANSKGKKGRKERISLDDFDPDMQQEILKVIKRRERGRKLLTAACVVICIACFGYLGVYYKVAAKSAQEFDELAKLKGSASYAAQGRGVKIHYTDEDTEAPDILPEYETLYNKNKRLIGWLKIADTNIDYPVMQTVDNEYYLDHNFNQESDKNGCIFMDYQCDAVHGNDNFILYGHHMKSGKMFGALNKYSQKSYYEDHKVIQFDTIYEKGKYEVMYVFRSKVYSEEDVNFKYYQFIDAGSEKEFESYISEMERMALYDTGVTASYGDRLLTLSTCDYQEDDGRFVVVAKKVA